MAEVLLFYIAGLAIKALNPTPRSRLIFIVGGFQKCGNYVRSAKEVDMDIWEELRLADARGVAPPQNWTTRAADEIERLRGLLEGLSAQPVTPCWCGELHMTGQHPTMVGEVGRGTSL